MALNIIDIAKLAGVSKSTVSRYLNNGYVSVESREKIKKFQNEVSWASSHLGPMVTSII